jgi:hypothetical protein
MKRRSGELGRSELHEMGAVQISLAKEFMK